MAAAVATARLHAEAARFAAECSSPESLLGAVAEDTAAEADDCWSDDDGGAARVASRTLEESMAAVSTRAGESAGADAARSGESGGAGVGGAGLHSAVRAILDDCEQLHRQTAVDGAPRHQRFTVC